MLQRFWGPKTEIFKVKFYVFFICREIVAFLVLYLLKKFWSPNFLNLIKQNISTGFICNSGKIFNCCFDQIREISILIKKWRKCRPLKQILAAKNRDFSVEKQRFSGVYFTLPRLNFFLLLGRSCINNETQAHAFLIEQRCVISYYYLNMPIPSSMRKG